MAASVPRAENIDPPLADPGFGAARADGAFAVGGGLRITHLLLVGRREVSHTVIAQLTRLNTRGTALRLRGSFNNKSPNYALSP